MVHDSDSPAVNRRRVLQTIGAGAALGLAGCSQQRADGEGPGNGTDGEELEKLGSELVGPDGNQVELTAVYSTGGSTTEKTMRYVKQQLGEVGIKVDLVGTPFDTMLSKYAQQTYEGRGPTFNAGPRDEATSKEPWDLMGGIGFNSYPLTPISIRPFWTDVAKRKEATVNFYGYKPSKPVGQMLDEAASTADEAKRQELLSDIFGLLSTDVPCNFLTFSVDLYGMRSNVRGLGVGDDLTADSFLFGYDDQKWHFSQGGGGGGGGGSPSVGGTYVVGAATDAKTLNPIRINDVESSDRVALTMDGAYTLDLEGEFASRWFERYETEDRRTYEFFLRDNLQWGADYGQMTADDWVYYIREVRQAQDNWAADVNHSDWFRNEEPIPIEKTGKLSFEVRLPEVDPAFIQKPILWGAYCLPEDLVAQYRDQENGGEKLNKSPEIRNLAYTGNLGPYTFERWQRDSVFVATRNDDYYLAESDVFEGDVPYFERFEYQVFGEESTRLAALETGEITQTGVPPREADNFQEAEDTKVVQAPNPFCGMLVYNQRANGWDQLRSKGVRQGLAMAVNKPFIVETIERGYANPAFTHQPEFSEWFDDSKVKQFGAGDLVGIAKAQHRLADSLGDGYEFQ